MEISLDLVLSTTCQIVSKCIATIKSQTQTQCQCILSYLEEYANPHATPKYVNNKQKFHPLGSDVYPDRRDILLGNAYPMWKPYRSKAYLDPNIHKRKGRQYNFNSLDL